MSEGISCIFIIQIAKLMCSDLFYPGSFDTRNEFPPSSEAAATQTSQGLVKLQRASPSAFLNKLYKRTRDQR